METHVSLSASKLLKTTFRMIGFIVISTFFLLTLLLLEGILGISIYKGHGFLAFTPIVLMIYGLLYMFYISVDVLIEIGNE